MTGLLIAWAASLMGGMPAQQCTTIAEHLAARPAEHRNQAAVLGSMYELLVVSWDELLVASDLVVEGTIRPLRSYVSQDGCRIMTDYALTARQAHRGSLPATSKPGESKPLIVTTLGGETIVNGVTVRYLVAESPGFREGQDVMLMVSRRAEGGYELAKDPHGAFEIVNGRVKPMLRNVDIPGFKEIDKTTFVAKVRR